MKLIFFSCIKISQVKLKYDRGEDTVRAEPGRLAVGTQRWVKMQVVWIQ